MIHILFCNKCSTYTLKELCSKCNGKTVRKIPMKYSDQDSGRKYRVIDLKAELLE